MVSQILISSWSIGSFDECVTSESDTGNEDENGQLEAPCQFPFILNKKTYWACTYDYGHLTGYKPWCSTKTDDNDNHIQGKFFKTEPH